MTPQQIEDLFLKSLDQPLTPAEKEVLAKVIELDDASIKNLKGYETMRAMLLRKEPATFGPYFAQKVITKIQHLREHVDEQIIWFFRKFQVAAVGLVIALVAVNVVFAEQPDVLSVLGIEETVVEDDMDTDEQIEEFNFLEILANN